MDKDWLFLFNRFTEWPLGLELFRPMRNATVIKMPETMFTVIPAECHFKRFGVEYTGMPNKWSKGLYMLVIYGASSEPACKKSKLDD